SATEDLRVLSGLRGVAIPMMPRRGRTSHAAWSPRRSATRIDAGTGVVPRRVSCFVVGTIDGAAARIRASPGAVACAVPVGSVVHQPSGDRAPGISLDSDGPPGCRALIGRGR